MREQNELKYLEKYLKKMRVQKNQYNAFNIERLIGEEVLEDEELNLTLCISYYMAELYKSTILNKFSKEIPLNIKKQLKKAQKAGHLSVYLATVGYGLSRFLQENVYSSFYIGYIEADGQTKVPHGCIMIDDKIIDVCGLYEIEGEQALEEFIYGSYPLDMRIWGWKMDSEFFNILRYFKRYTRGSVEKIIIDHRQAMVEVMSTFSEREDQPVAEGE